MFANSTTCTASGSTRPSPADARIASAQNTTGALVASINGSTGSIARHTDAPSVEAGTGARRRSSGSGA